MSLDQALDVRIKELAQKIYEERIQNNIPGDDKADWDRAYNMIINYQNVGTDANTWAEEN